MFVMSLVFISVCRSVCLSLVVSFLRYVFIPCVLSLFMYFVRCCVCIRYFVLSCFLYLCISLFRCLVISFGISFGMSLCISFVLRFVSSFFLSLFMSVLFLYVCSSFVLRSLGR